MKDGVCRSKALPLEVQVPPVGTADVNNGHNGKKLSAEKN